MRTVRYNRYGPPEVLSVVETDEPQVSPGEVLVRLDVAGLNPVDSKQRRGLAPVRPLPSGIGREFSGHVIGLGDGVGDLRIGDAVVGTGEQVIGEYLVSARPLVMRYPNTIDPTVAACVPVAPQTAWCALHSQPLSAGDTIFVSAVAGGVGFVLAQLAIRAGLHVIGSASPRHDDRLRALGVHRVDYGPGLASRLHTVATTGIDAVFDQAGPETIEAALELGVPRERINSVSGHAARYAVASVGRVGLDVPIMNQLFALIESGEVTIPIEARYPLDDIVIAYRHLEQESPSGRIVVAF